MALCAWQFSPHAGAKIVYRALPNAKVVIADNGYDSNGLRAPQAYPDWTMNPARTQAEDANPLR